MVGTLLLWLENDFICPCRRVDHVTFRRNKCRLSSSFRCYFSFLIGKWRNGFQRFGKKPRRILLLGRNRSEGEFVAFAMSCVERLHWKPRHILLEDTSYHWSRWLTIKFLRNQLQWITVLRHQYFLGLTELNLEFSLNFDIFRDIRPDCYWRGERVT